MSLVQTALLCLEYGKPPLEDGLLASAIMILVDNKGSGDGKEKWSKFQSW